MTHIVVDNPLSFDKAYTQVLTRILVGVTEAGLAGTVAGLELSRLSRLLEATRLSFDKAYTWVLTRVLVDVTEAGLAGTEAELLRASKTAAHEEIDAMTSRAVDVATRFGNDMHEVGAGHRQRRKRTPPRRFDQGLFSKMTRART